MYSLTILEAIVSHLAKDTPPITALDTTSLSFPEMQLKYVMVSSKIIR